MAYKFNDEDKTVKEFSESLPFGVSKVQFAGALTDETEAGKEFIEVAIVNEAGIEDTARCWFVGGAANISFNTLRQIAVHQGKDEAEKAKIRDRVDNVADSQELVDILNDVCAGGELWFTKYYDPSRTYVSQDGVTRRSINKNIYGYEPKEKPDLMPNKQSADDRNEEITKDNVAEHFPEGEKLSGNDIPEDWSK